MSKMIHKPEIRFPGFTEDWEQRKFGEMVQRVSTSAISTSGLPAVEYEDVVAGEGLLNKDVYDKNVEKKGIAFNGTEVLYGKLRPYLHNWLNPRFKGVAVGDWWVLQSEVLEKGFLYRLIQTNQFDEIANQSAGSKMPRADWNLVSNAEFSVPKTREEQHKIAEMFDELDKTITLHQRKCDETKKLKQVLLQKMYPKEDQNTPEIRFPGFTEDWEQRKLGDVFLQTSNIVNPEQDNVELWSLTVENGLTPKTERYERGFLVKKEDNFKLVRPGDIVYNPMNMTLGAVGYNEMSKTVAVSGYYTTMVTKEGYDSGYINTWLKSPQAILLYKSYATGTLIEKQRVQFPTLCTIPASFPSIEEQKQIGKFFSELDKTITLHQCKCDETKKLKQALLQKMFV